MNRSKALKIAGGGMASLFLLLLPVLLPEIDVHLAAEILVFALFAVSFNLLLGYCGLLPFGHAACFGVGAYATALIFKHITGMPFLITIMISALSGFVGALIIGFFCVRLSGAYFALISLAFQMFLYAVALKWRDVTSGDDGMSVPRPDFYLPGLGTFSLMNIQYLYYITLVIVVLAILACYLFLKTPLGHAAISMRENVTRASFLGFNVFLTRLAVFCFSGLLAGIAGALFVVHQEFVATTVMDVHMAFTVMLMATIGGTGHFLGPVLGAVFFMVFQDWISSLTKHWWLFMGIFFVVVVLYAEGGLIGLFQWKKIRARFASEKES
jgi:branched-chain amino acid transport system permease protein